MHSEPQKEHNWLQQMVGDWTYESEATMEPGKPPVKTTGTDKVRSLGGLWIVGEGEGSMPGGGVATMIITLGFDPETKRFVGTWIGSMMTKLWVYDGFLNESETILALDAEGPSMAGDGKVVTYRDSMEIKNPDHRILTSQIKNEDGTWTLFMTSHYRRVK